ncbi:hypothetical protein Sme01_31290 [Sphaerisporangium melleum]|uniref:Uncharacterized protein n=1 Tax=Sphaerisporangium melleum TaxID=321316 RepID=A0A917R8Q1_9ACTN|nr:hypothetical protein [Sphaerisporangium melleum]GGK95845.1 hypothetical protein GCM10007964_42710 [Sphaerisporangium melleum]GII70653.1 hypothetical protein Sme01_31290 [Sphaerisporangium melleum]
MRVANATGGTFTLTFEGRTAEPITASGAGLTGTATPAVATSTAQAGG